ncbi:MAG: ATP-binding protein [Patescibacteria group bacterium]
MDTQNIQRHIDKQLRGHFEKYKQAIILLGPRQAGKTTLVRRLFPQAFYLTCDNEPVKKAFESYDVHYYRQIIPQSARYLILDEANLIENPGRAGKILVDQLPQLHTIITGSSSLAIRQKTTESMAGRFVEYRLFPLSFDEYLYQTRVKSELGYSFGERMLNRSTAEKGTHLFDMKKTLEKVLLFGLYPEVINLSSDIPYLKTLAGTLALKDVQEMNLFEKRKEAEDLLRLLAYQIGNLINYSDLSRRTGLTLDTVKRYISIFEDSYILYRVYPYVSNRRDEIGKSPKIYFYDTGLRNALINAFESLSIRSDAGALFENFILNETIKYNGYIKSGVRIHYWRTRHGSEVDLILQDSDLYRAYEIKLTKNNSSGIRSFLKRYPRFQGSVINMMNFY